MPITDPDAVIPAELTTERFVLRPITAADAELDYAAVMETREHLRLWEQSTWPADDFTVEANREDLVDLETRHADHRAFTYTVLDPDEVESRGCVYVFAPDASFLAKSTVTALADDVWDDLDAVVYFWARLSQMDQGMDEQLLAALRSWFIDAWKLERVVYVTNERFIQQVALLDSTDLRRVFEFVEPGKPGAYLAYT